MGGYRLPTRGLQTECQLRPKCKHLALSLALLFMLIASACGSQTGDYQRAVATGAPDPTLAVPIPTLDPSRFEPGLPPEVLARYAESRVKCRLPDELVRLMVFPDPDRRARGMGLKYENGRVEVLIERVPGANWDDLVARYHIQELGRSDQFMGAQVPQETLCDLSNDPGVSHIRRLVRAVPASPGVSPQPFPTR